jgi:hypothetical protein
MDERQNALFELVATVLRPRGGGQAASRRRTLDIGQPGLWDREDDVNRLGLIDRDHR